MVRALQGADLTPSFLERLDDKKPRAKPRVVSSKCALAAMTANRPNGLQIKSGDGGNHVESGLAFNAHRL
jgi:hypothetical protein